jgi:hypothetical protein
VDIAASSQDPIRRDPTMKATLSETLRHSPAVGADRTSLLANLRQPFRQLIYLLLCL